LSLIRFMTKAQLKLKIAEAIADLTSGSQTKALGALKLLETIGDKSVLPSLIGGLKKNDAALTKGILELIANIQDQEIAEDLVEAIRNEKEATIRQQLLTTIWNSKLDFSEYLAEFVSLATEGDFLQALECLTILENLSGPFEEHQLLEAQLYLKDYAEDLEEKEDRKHQIISEIALFIKDQNEGIDADLLLE
jgi:hypothetical protein